MRHFWLELSSASKLFFFFWIVQSMLWSLTMCLVIHPMFCNLTCNLVTGWIKISLYNWLIVLWLVISLEQISNKLDKNICKLFDLTISSSSTDVQRSFFFFFWFLCGGEGEELGDVAHLYLSLTNLVFWLGQLGQIMSECISLGNWRRLEDSFDFWPSLTGASSMLSIVVETMGLLCSRNRHYNGADTEENAHVSYAW